MGSHSVRAAALLTGAVFTLAVGIPAARQVSQDQPVFRSGVHLVEVDVRVFDRSGRFVTDLTRDEFEVLEGGVPQQLEALYLIGSPAGLAAKISPDPAGPGGPEPLPATAPAARHTWVFVFDTNHLVPGAGFDRARKAVEDFLSSKFREGDVAGILADGRMVNNRLTSVREELVAAVKDVKPKSELRSLQVELTRDWPRLQDAGEAILISNNDREALQRAVIRACSDDPSACQVATPDLEIRTKARRFHQAFEQASKSTLATVNALSSGLAKMPGPKTIVFLSDGFVIDRMETALQQAVGQTARAGGRVYAIDVRGLNRGRGAGIIDQAAVDDPAGGPAQFDVQADGPNSLAIDTGGLMIRNENNIGRALDRIAEDAGTYYVIAYRPADQGFDGKYRPIQVRVKRPDVQVRARRGYLALEPSRMVVPQPIKPPTGGGGEPAAAPSEAPAATAMADPTLPADPTTPSVSGTIVEGAATTSGDHLRMRPGVTERVREMSRGETKASGGLAARGWAAYERGDVESASAAFAEAVKQPGVRPWVLYAFGLCQIALGRPVEAAASWERVREAEPGFDPVYVDLADAYLQLGNVSRALEVLRDGSARWPSDPEFHNAIGVIHVRRGALDDGIAAFSRAAAAEPDAPLAYFNLGRAYEMRFARSHRYVRTEGRWMSSGSDREKAAEYYERCIRLGGPYVQAADEALKRLEWSR